MKKPIEKEMKLKIASISIAIIGIASLVFTQVGAQYFEEFLLVDAQPRVLNTNSAVYVNQSFNTVFTLKQGYKCDVVISNIYDNNGSEDIGVDLRFVPLGTYLNARENPTDPDSLTSLYFQEIEYKYPDNPTRDADNEVSGGVIDENEVYTYEFMGNGDTNDIWSLPGQYAVIIWVTNSGLGTTGSFGVRISVDGQGDLLRTIFYWLGGILILVAAILAVAYIILNRRR